MPNPLVHFDIHGADEPALHRFYGEELGWNVEPKGPGYALIGTGGEGPDGAIVEGAEAAIVVGVGVDDLEAAVGRLSSLGGTVEMPPTDNGWVVKAAVRDPAGNLITLIQR